MRSKGLAQWVILLLFWVSPVCADEVSEAQRVAEQQYVAATEGYREEWLEFFQRRPREEFKKLIEERVNGCELELTWIKSQRSVERGITYRYVSGEVTGEDKIKLLFQPYLKNGRKTFSTVPVFLVREGRTWKIRSLRYH